MINRASISTTDLGCQSLAPKRVLPRHRHAQPYVALVLAGGYSEAGDEGRWRVGPGDALVHPAYGAHLDGIDTRGAVVLNLPLPTQHAWPPAFRVHDVDAIARLAQTDVFAAAALLEPAGALVPAADWPDLLAAALREDPGLRLDAWAECAGLAPETLSRGFRAAFGTTPARFRAEVRARRAFERLLDSDVPLAALAHDGGFADQSHFTRAIVELTGAPPRHWRAGSRAETPIGVTP